MTNKEDAEEPPCDLRMATSVAVLLVGQVLDEAYIIVNSAKDSGKTWNYLANVKKFKRNRLDEACARNLTFTVLKGDCLDEIKTDSLLLPIVTSTPQKVEIESSKNELVIIGQGDEELENVSEPSKSTSMFINHLFDLSDIEDLICYNRPSVCEADSSAVAAKIIESCVHLALQNIIDTEEDIGDVESSIHDSSYSFLADAVLADDCSDITKYIEQNECGSSRQIEIVPENVTVETSKRDVLTYCGAAQEKNDLCSYEYVYLTLNRDYEQYSDEEPVLQDPKGSCLQEIELGATGISNDNVIEFEPLTNIKETTSVVSTTETSRKSKFAGRCRMHGERLLSCLRMWWWRRKPERKYKITRVPSTARGLCVLSPDARRRTASLLDRSNLKSPLPSRSNVRKFNTISEAIINSCRWKHLAE